MPPPTSTAPAAGGACSDARTAAQAASPATPWCSLVTAAMRRPSGSTVLVRGGCYPTRASTAPAGRRAATMTMKAYPGETPVVAAVDIRDFSHLRFEGLRFSGTMNLVYFGNDHIEFVGNDLTNAVNIRGSRDILFDGNHFHDGPDSCTVDSSEAGGVRSMTGTQNLTIRGNHFERLTGDAIQMDGTGVLIEGNTFDHIQVRPGCSAHTDVIQSLGAEDVTIRGNVARDNDSGILNSSADHQTRGGRSRTTSSPARAARRCSSTTRWTTSSSRTTRSPRAASASCSAGGRTPACPSTARAFVIATTCSTTATASTRSSHRGRRLQPRPPARTATARTTSPPPRASSTPPRPLRPAGRQPGRQLGNDGAVADNPRAGYSLPPPTSSAVPARASTTAAPTSSARRRPTPAPPATRRARRRPAPPHPTPDPRCPSTRLRPVRARRRARPTTGPRAGSSPATPPRLIGVTFPHVVRAVSTARLRAALRSATHAARPPRAPVPFGRRGAPAPTSASASTATRPSPSPSPPRPGRRELGARQSSPARARTPSRSPPAAACDPGRYAVRITAVAGGRTATTTQTGVVRRG